MNVANRCVRCYFAVGSKFLRYRNDSKNAKVRNVLRCIYEMIFSKINTPAKPATPTIVSITVQLRMVWERFKLNHSL